MSIRMKTVIWTRPGRNAFQVIKYKTGSNKASEIPRFNAYFFAYLNTAISKCSLEFCKS